MVGFTENIDKLYLYECSPHFTTQLDYDLNRTIYLSDIVLVNSALEFRRCTPFIKELYECTTTMGRNILRIKGDKYAWLYKQAAYLITSFLMKFFEYFMKGSEFGESYLLNTAMYKYKMNYSSLQALNKYYGEILLPESETGKLLKDKRVENSDNAALLTLMLKLLNPLSYASLSVLMCVLIPKEELRQNELAKNVRRADGEVVALLDIFTDEKTPFKNYKIYVHLLNDVVRKDLIKRINER
jgi:hypothetical protein